MKRHAVWIGVNAESALCGNSFAHDFVECARDLGKVRTTPDGLRLQAVRNDDTVVGYGVITAVTPPGGTAEFNCDDLAADTERVRRAFQLLGLHGPVTVHIQSVDMSGPVAVA